MTQIPISQLPDGTTSQSKSMEIAGEQDGVTVKTTTAPTPKMLFYVMNQTQLENHFPDGSGGILIPDNEAWMIVITEDFNLSKPIKMGLNSRLKLIDGATGTNITYSSTLAMFKNENPTNKINILEIDGGITITSTNTAPLVDIVGNIFLRIRNATIRNFESLGMVESMFVEIDSSAGVDIQDGISIIEPQGVRVTNFSHSNFGPPATFTLLKILSTGNPSVLIDGVSVFNGNVDVVFLDPSSGVTSKYTVQNIEGTFNELFVQGADKVVTMVSNAGGQARFASPSHGFVTGDMIVHSGFTNPSYNGTFVVGTVPTGSEYMAGVAFVSNDSGNVTQAGRDSTDVTVRAINNVTEADSMFTGDAGLEIFGDEEEVIITTVNVPNFIPNPDWAFSNLERFKIGLSTQGQLIAEDTATRRYTIGYSGTIEKVGGGSVNIGIVLLKNGSIISFNAPHTVNTGKIQISGSDIIELTKDDTLQVAVINYADTSNIEVSQAGLVVNLA